MNLFRSILSVAFALLVLISGSSFIIGIHLCSGEVQQVALFDKADGCERERQLPPCHRHETFPCCQDETIFHEGQSFKVDAQQISINSAPIADAIQPSVLVAEIIPSSLLAEIPFLNYDAPLRATDLTITFQVFLI